MEDFIKRQLLESAGVKQELAGRFAAAIAQAAGVCAQAIKNGRKMMFCGNGGSAADSQHLASELVVRLTGKSDRRALPGLALTTDTSLLTACANDFGYVNVFARQLEALGQPGDVLIAISTSGNSPNVVKAVETAKRLGIKTIGFTGKTPGRFNALLDLVIPVPSDDVQRIQEAHIAIGHIMIGLVEREVM